MIKDYLHSKLLSKGKNDLVFQKTYTTIHEIATELTTSEMRRLGIKKDSTSLDLDLNKANADIIAERIIKLVNYTIHNFEK